MQVVRREFPEEKYDLKASFPVKFDASGIITVDIPEKGLQLENGWEITPLFRRGVSILNCHRGYVTCF